MAGQTLILSYAEGTDTLAPLQNFINASQVASYVDVAAFESAKGSVSSQDDFFLNTTTSRLQYYDTAWIEIQSMSELKSLLNSGGDQVTADGSAGVEVQMTDATNAVLTYDSTLTSKWKAGELGSEVEIADVSTAQTLTNKKLNGGTASAVNEWLLPQDTTANLGLLTDAKSSFAYDTTTDKPVYNDGAGWNVIGGATVLNELSDVVESSSSEGQQLVHDGSTYVNADMANNNLVINGCMKIMQIADFDTSAVTVLHNTFTLDRWKTKVGTVTANTQRLSTGQPTALTTSKSLRLTATSTATGNIGYRTFIEMDDTFINKTLTLSAYVKSNNANTRLGYYNGTSTVYSATSHTGGGGWELLTITYTMSGSLATTMCQVGVYTISAAGADVAISTNDYLELTGVGLYFGSIAYPFQPRLIADEYNRCQRYYFKTYDYGVYAGASSVNGLLVEQGGDNVAGNTNTSSTFNFPVGMRISPVITYYDQVGNASRVTYGLANGTITNNQNPTLTAAASNANQARFGITLPAGNNGFQMHFVAVAE